MLNLQCEEKIQVTGTLFLYQNLTPMIQKLQETLFFISNFSYYYFWLAKNQSFFQPKIMFFFKSNLEMKKHQFNFELILVVSWKPFPMNDPRATMLC